MRARRYTCAASAHAQARRDKSRTLSGLCPFYCSAILSCLSVSLSFSLSPPFSLSHLIPSSVLSLSLFFGRILPLSLDTALTYTKKRASPMLYTLFPSSSFGRAGIEAFFVAAMV